MEYRCPKCKKMLEPPESGENPTEGKYFPFCSERCKLIDIGAWLDGEYTIPSQQVGGQNDPDDLS